jgi:hypothetical protein
MTIWKVASVPEQPELVLKRWRAYEVEDLRFLVGWNATDGEGRVSTYVASFDPALRRVETGSGRVYKLSGPPGHDNDADYTWTRWKRMHGVSDVRDVTDEVWSAILAASDKNAGKN